MEIDTKKLISISKANKNFSQVSKYIDKIGNAIILKNNKPKYYIVKIDEDDPLLDLTDDEKIIIVAKRILHKHKYAFKELSKWLNSIKKKFYCYTN